jgi:hypothetical protein
MKASDMSASVCQHTPPDLIQYVSTNITRISKWRAYIIPILIKYNSLRVNYLRTLNLSKRYKSTVEEE